MTPPEGLSLRLIAPERATTRTRVPLTIELRNTGSAPIQLGLRGRTVTFDLTAADDRGTIVWRRLEGVTSQMILQLRILEPGEALALRDGWDQTDNDGIAVNPGTYMLVGYVFTDDPDPLRTAPAAIRILGAQ